MLGGHSKDVAREVTAFLAGQDGPNSKHRSADGRHGVQPLSRVAEIRPLQERLFFQHEEPGARPAAGFPLSVKCRPIPNSPNSAGNTHMPLGIAAYRRQPSRMPGTGVGGFSIRWPP